MESQQALRALDGIIAIQNARPVRRAISLRSHRSFQPRRPWVCCVEGVKLTEGRRNVC